MKASKNIKKLVLICVLSILFLIIFSNKVNAMFDISLYNIDAKLLDNGDMEVHESLSYNVNEKANGVFRNIKFNNEYNEKNSAKGLELESVVVDGNTIRKVPAASNGQEGVFTLKNKSGELDIKVYTVFDPKLKDYSTDQDKKVEYTYLLKNVGIQYEDIAELYWNFVGTEWEDPIRILNINIELPEGAQNDKIYVFGHGSDNGTFKKDGKFIKLSARNLKPGQAVDARVVFNKDALGTQARKYNEKALSKLLKEEEGWHSTMPAKRIAGLNCRDLSIVLSVIFAIFEIIVLTHGRRKVAYKYDLIREIPYKMNPAELEYIYDNDHDSERSTFWVSILELLRKGAIKFEKYTNKSGNERTNYVLSKERIPLDNIDKKALDIIVPFMSKDENEKTYVDSEELKGKINESTNVSSKYRDYISAIKESITSRFGKKDENMYNKIGLGFAIVSVALILIFAFLYGTSDIQEILQVAIYMTMFTAFFSFIATGVKNNMVVNFFIGVIGFTMLCVALGKLFELNAAWLICPYLVMIIPLRFILKRKSYTKEYEDARSQIRAFRKFLNDYTLISKRNQEEIVLWEEYLISAVALNLNYNVIDYYYQYGITNTTDSFAQSMNNGERNKNHYYHFYDSYGSTFERSRNIGYTPASSSYYTRSSGGFSGGSGTGGGGGGRRWRWPFLKNKIYVKR